MLAFIGYNYWKKYKGGGKSIGPNSTSDPSLEGWRQEEIELDKMKERNAQLEDEVTKTRSELGNALSENKTLELSIAALKVKLDTLELNYLSCIEELKLLKAEKEELFSTQLELSKKESSMSQTLQHRDTQLSEQKAIWEATNRELESLGSDFKLQSQQLKQLEIERSELLTREENLKTNYHKAIEELKELRAHTKLLQNEKLNLIQQLTSLTHERDRQLEEKENLKSQYVYSWKFYEALRNSGLEVDVTKLREYREFYQSNFELIQSYRRKEEREKNRTTAGKGFELQWGEEAKSLFTSEELKYILFEAQPQNDQDGNKGDFRVVFRDNTNFCSAEKVLNIYIEHKYATKKEEMLGEPEAVKHPQMNREIRKAIENVKKSEDKYDFIFFITNREIGKEEFREKEYFLIETDEDYRHFNLEAPKFSHDRELKILILTYKKSLESLWSLYMLWKIWMPKAPLNLKGLSSELLNEIDKFLESASQLHDGLSSSMAEQWRKVIKPVREVIQYWCAKESELKTLSLRADGLRTRFAAPQLDSDIGNTAEITDDRDSHSIISNEGPSSEHLENIEAPLLSSKLHVLKTIQEERESLN
ncbi:hypothetical protein [Candidatus Mycoplasma haematominutum]|uniref:hypothetical protein n=1 Tax=Candidatus Mycoplasma haematominutum TaxID=209446 RepID=UPI0005C769A2|nr:hypothetical protein [Candidatus Mycoplasma haematominutum]